MRVNYMFKLKIRQWLSWLLDVFIASLEPDFPILGNSVNEGAEDE